ncbi:MAG TPA: acetate--CoA ligase family protein, partial [Actinomycetota bacterium]|nr:acetate--CoA ligase family protein [Actinomycetota bacterium]
LDAPDVGGGPWTEHAAKRLLREIGIPVTREEEVREVEEAVEAAQRIGFPVVAKAAGIAHKTEVGGVRLGLATEQAVREAAAEVLRLGAGLLVSEEVRGRLELLVGAFRDAQFGVCGLLGLGGIWTEALGQAVVLPGPGSEDVVRRALEDAPWGRLLLEDVRGVPLPLGRVTDVLFRLIDLVEGMPVEAIEINPLVVREDGVVAVDALLVPREGAR